MAAVLEPASCGGNLPIPAQPWIPVRYGTDAIPVIGAPDPAAATSTLARAVSGLPGLMKAVLDVLAALLLLVVLSPVLVALALAVRADGDPAFFRQTRVGLDGREFTMVKFRSMVVDAEARLAALQAENEGAGPLFKLRHDPRVTRVGAALRKYSLDELPQLFNVVTGRMSLPHRPPACAAPRARPVRPAHGEFRRPSAAAGCTAGRVHPARRGSNSFASLAAHFRRHQPAGSRGSGGSCYTVVHVVADQRALS